MIANPIPPDPPLRFAIAACARWELGYVAEWLGYHRAIGCDHVWLYCNDDDPTALYAEILPFLAAPTPFVTFIHYPFIGQQRQMYLHFLRHHAHNADWVGFIDLDEFLWLPEGQTIAGFIANFAADFQAIALNWVFFGPSGFAQRPPGSVLLTYRRRAFDPDPLTKTLIRVDAIPPGFANADPQRDFWHFWHGPPAIACCNSLGESMAGYFVDFPHRAHPFIHAEGREHRLIAAGAIAHYAFKSEADFTRRAARSLTGDFAAQAQWAALAKVGGVATLAARLNEVEENALAERWAAHLAQAWRHGILPRPPHPNIAPHGLARQSSNAPPPAGVTPWGAQAALSGTPLGRLQCQTLVENAPWWEVEFPTPVTVHELRLLNPPGLAKATHAALQIEAWLPQSGYTPIHRNPAQPPFGGVDGTPLCLAFTPPVAAQRLRIATYGQRALGFDQVEIYGH